VQVYTAGGPEFKYWMAQSIELRKMMEAHKKELRSLQEVVEELVTTTVLKRV